MQVFLLSLFPRALESYFETSMMKRAQDLEYLHLTVINLADYSIRNTRRVDDRPYGGGAGTILAAEPCARAIEHVQSLSNTEINWIVPDPRGIPLCQEYLQVSSQSTQALGILCGHYEGIDERVLMHFNIRKISLGPYIITGGELAAGIIIDGIIRLIPGLLGTQSLKDESHSPGIAGRLEYPHFTRPEIWRELPVPKELLSGNHAAIAAWRIANTLPN